MQVSHTDLAVQKLRERGYKAADVHVHTSHSRDVATIDELSAKKLYEKAEKKRMDFITFTDHDTIRAHKKKLGDKHVSGVELSVNDSEIGFEVHINIYCVNTKQFDYLKKNQDDIKKVLAYCNKHSLPHTYNHPFWFAKKDYSYVAKNPKQVYASICWLIKHIDVIEINHSRPAYQNILAKQLAKKYHKALITGTDTHTGNIAGAYTLAQGDTFNEWFENVKNHKGVLVAEKTSDHFFDIEAYQYMKHLMRPRKDSISIETDNVLADAIIRYTNTFTTLSRITKPVLWPVVALATRSGVARKWYFFMQKHYTNKMVSY